MFKYLGPISSLARPIPRRRLSILSENGLVRIQRVHIRKPFLNRKHGLLFLGTTTLLCYYGLDITVEEEDDEEDQVRHKNKPSKHSKKAPSNVLAKAANKDKHAASTARGIPGERKDGNKVEGQEDAIFIRLGSKHERPQTLYQKTDPEYQSFEDFRRDGRKIRSAQIEFAEMACQAISITPPFPQVLGAPLNVRSFWVNFQIPSGPPPEYEQSGIVITNEDIAWTTRSISAAQYSGFQSMLQPLPILSALWASCRTFSSSRWARVHEMTAFGSKPEDLNNGSSSISLNLRKLIKVRSNEDTQINSGIKDPPPEPNKGLAKNGPTDDDSQKPSKSEQSSNSDNLSPLEQDLNAAFMAFENTLESKWKTPGLVPERGTIVASGFVQVVGPRGVCVLQVKAFYHPRESRFTPTFSVTPREVLRKT